jgi:hypothetical protein
MWFRTNTANTLQPIFASNTKKGVKHFFVFQKRTPQNTAPQRSRAEIILEFQQQAKSLSKEIRAFVKERKLNTELKRISVGNGGLAMIEVHCTDKLRDLVLEWNPKLVMIDGDIPFE